MLHFRCAPCSKTKIFCSAFFVLRSAFASLRLTSYWAGRRCCLRRPFVFCPKPQAPCSACLLPKASASCLSPETRPLSVPLPKCFRALAEKQRAYLRLEPHHVMRKRCTRRSLSAEKQPQKQTSAGHTTVSEKPCPTKNRQHPLYKYLEKRQKNGNTCPCEALRRLYLNLVSKNSQKHNF